MKHVSSKIRTLVRNHTLDRALILSEAVWSQVNDNINAELGIFRTMILDIHDIAYGYEIHENR